MPSFTKTPLADTLNSIGKKLRKAGFTKVTHEPGASGRATIINADGVMIHVKAATRGETGQRRWVINLHRRGVLDESNIDAYIFHLISPDFLDFYLVFPAPIGKTSIAFTPSTVARVYSGNIDNWGLLTKLSKKKRKAV